MRADRANAGRSRPTGWGGAILGGGVAALVLAVAGCGSCKGKHRKPRPGELIVHIGSEPPHLNPLLQEDVWLWRITLHNIFEGLLRRHPQSYKFVPALATRWSFSPGGRVLTFRIRKGVTFHDGKPFGADDVIFTFDRLMDPKVTSASSRSDFTELKKWEKSDADTVRLTFAKPGFKILESLSHLSILPRHVYGTGNLNNHPANHRPVGTGPFRFDSWRRGAAIVVSRYGGYWGPKPALRRVIYRIIKSKEKAFELLKKGELDLMPRVLPQHACGAKAPVRDPRIAKRYRLIIHYPVQFYTVVLNVQNPVLQDVRVRRALSLLVNRELIADKIFCGRARRISGPYWLGRPGYDARVKPRPYDPRQAAKLLAAAGWTDSDNDGVLDRQGKRLELTYLRFAESSVQRRLLPILQEELRKAGLKLHVETISWTAALKRMKQHRFDLTDLNWFYYYEQDLYQIYHSSQCHGGSNYGCYANPEVDRLLVQIRATLDDARRGALERKLHRLLHDDLPGLYLFNVGDLTVVSRRFTGVTPSAEWFQMRDIKPAPGSNE
ncbi:MAG: ABC transporter substrate-binding protein [bacterium]